MSRTIKRNLLWMAYVFFLIVAVAFGGTEGLLDFSAPLPWGKALIWIVFIAFLGYSIQAHRKENFLRSVTSVNRLWWGLQIGLDLYISVFLSLALIYLVEGSLLVTLAWTIPILIFANLAILPYIILNYGVIIGAFV